jgi:HEAT repeat protein
MALLDDRDLGCQKSAAEALAKMGPRSWEAAEALGRKLSHPDAGMRASAAEALKAIGPQGFKALPYLTRALGDPGLSDRVTGVFVAIGKASAPALVETLTKGTRQQRLPAIRTLGQLGPNAREAAPTLRNISKSKDEMPDIRRAAAEALLKIEK